MSLHKGLDMIEYHSPKDVRLPDWILYLRKSMSGKAKGGITMIESQSERILISGSTES